MATSETVKRRFEIVDGPSKDDLQKSLFDKPCCPEHRVVVFRLKSRDFPEIEATIGRVEREDDSGESWNIAGHWYEPFTDDNLHPASGSFEGYYRTNKRRGFLNI